MSIISDAADAVAVRRLESINIVSIRAVGQSLSTRWNAFDAGLLAALTRFRTVLACCGHGWPISVDNNAVNSSVLVFSRSRVSVCLCLCLCLSV